MKLTNAETKWVHMHDPRWSPPKTRQKLRVQVRINSAMQNRIVRGANIQQLLVYPPRTAAKHTTVVLQLRGTSSQLVVPPKVQPLHIAEQSVHVMGYDLNRLSLQAVTFGALDSHRKEIPLPIVSSPELQKVEAINRSLRNCDEAVSRLQRLIWKYSANTQRISKYVAELRLVHRRRRNLKMEAELCIAKSIYTRIRNVRPRIVAYEDLRGMSTRGKRGSLAKIVNYMCKRSDTLAERVQAWLHILPNSPRFIAVNSRNTSKIHFQCGGTLQRGPGSWDIAPCTRCGQRVNTQLNAPLRIADKSCDISANEIASPTLARRRVQTTDIDDDVQVCLK